jgi:hypothetical protein
MKGAVVRPNGRQHSIYVLPSHEKARRGPVSGGDGNIAEGILDIAFDDIASSPRRAYEIEDAIHGNILYSRGRVGGGLVNTATRRVGEIMDTAPASVVFGHKP